MHFSMLLLKPYVFIKKLYKNIWQRICSIFFFTFRKLLLILQKFYWTKHTGSVHCVLLNKNNNLAKISNIYFFNIFLLGWYGMSAMYGYGRESLFGGRRFRKQALFPGEHCRQGKRRYCILKEFFPSIHSKILNFRAIFPIAKVYQMLFFSIRKFIYDKIVIFGKVTKFHFLYTSPGFYILYLESFFRCAEK